MTRHEIDVTSLVSGLGLMTVAMVWLLVEIGVLTVASLPLVVPALLVAVGTVGVVIAVVRSRRQTDAQAL